jgi:hypothetical protein
MGFADRRECPRLCRLAAEYIRKCEGCEEDIYAFFAQEPDADSLYVTLVEEFERCILSYFAFHWSHADLLISQVNEMCLTCTYRLQNLSFLAF